MGILRGEPGRKPDLVFREKKTNRLVIVEIKTFEAYPQAVRLSSTHVEHRLPGTGGRALSEGDRRPRVEIIARGYLRTTFFGRCGARGFATPRRPDFLPLIARLDVPARAGVGALT